jgi:hypothetical protein
MSQGLRAGPQPRGEPLLVLAAIVGGWLALRVVLWQPPFAMSPHHALPWRASPVPSNAESTPGRAPRRVPPVDAVRSAFSGGDEAPITGRLPSPWGVAASVRNFSGRAPVAFEAPPARRVVGQQLLLAAAFAHMELAPEIAAYFLAEPPGGARALAFAGEQPLLGRNAPRLPTASSRWSGDGWLLLRGGSSGPLTAVGPSYGRSQAGAVLRYRLAESSGHRPVAYARATRALQGPPETEVAAGFAGRPFARLPLSVAGELRVTEGSAGREVRPAAFAVTELPPARLPRGFRAEVYAQAGYVGGRFATPFVDGQARIDTQVARLGKGAEVRAGGGVWGGAERHAARLDVGPSAMVSFRLGEAPSRVAVDYRLRIAGDAAPASGPALTFSAGF